MVNREEDKRYRVTKLDGALIWFLYTYCEYRAVDLSARLDLSEQHIYRIVNLYDRANTKDILSILRSITMKIILGDLGELGLLDLPASTAGSIDNNNRGDGEELLPLRGEQPQHVG